MKPSFLLFYGICGRSFGGLVDVLTIQVLVSIMEDEGYIRSLRGIKEIKQYSCGVFE